MKYTKLSNSQYLLRLYSNDEIIKSLTDFAQIFKDQFIDFSGIGAVNKAEISCYNTKKLLYDKTVLDGDFEILSLLGNITSLNSQPLIHAHICLAGKNFQAQGGHLNFARISITAEIVANISPQKIVRQKDEKFAINLIDLEDHGQSQPI